MQMYGRCISPKALALPRPSSTPRLLRCRPRLAPTQRLVTTAAAPPAASEAATESFVRVATGVPLKDLLQTMTLTEAAIESTMLISIALVVILFGNKIIEFMGTQMSKALGALGKKEKDQKKGRLAEFLSTALAAAERPCQALLPWFGFTYVSTVLSAFGEIALIRLREQYGPTSAQNIWVGSWGQNLVNFLQDTAQLMQDLSEVSLIIFGFWFFINLKNRLVETIMGSAAVNSVDEDNLARIVFPVSTLISWASVAACALLSLSAMGINVKPVLALGSVSTLAIGFASQSTVANVVSAFSLYTSRPFIAGDRVQLKTPSGATLVSGTVEKIMPMHTVIKTDAETPIFVHNKDIASSLLVINESKVLRSAKTPACPIIDTTITVRYKDVDKIPAIQKEANAWLKAYPHRVPNTTCRCYLEKFNELGPVLAVKITLSREVASRKGEIFMEILLEMEKAVRRNGAFLAMDEHVELPPSLPPSTPAPAQA